MPATIPRLAKYFRTFAPVRVIVLSLIDFKWDELIYAELPLESAPCLNLAVFGKH
jgi:hypothetical protein